MYTGRPLNWVTAIFLLLYHLMALAALFLLPFRWAYLPVLAGMYAWIAFSVTFYLHRYLSHRAFEIARPIRAFFWLGATIGQQGDPIGWVAHHRWHHAHSDQVDDAHSPVQGLWHAHLGWVIRIQPLGGNPILKLARDVLEREPLPRYAHEKRWPLMVPNLVVGGLLYLALGFGGLCWCLFLPIVLVSHQAWIVNSLGHWPRFGYRNVETRDQSRNSLWLGVLTLGDGFHNNHHAWPACARHGWRWYEVDLTALLIWGLERVGLAWDVRWERVGV